MHSLVGGSRFDFFAYAMETDDLVVCPYDTTHVVNAVRMPYHLMKCRKNYPNVELAICPFNASHEVQKPELKYHMLNCPNRTILEKEIKHEAYLGAPAIVGPTKKGHTDLPRYRDSPLDLPEADENWAADENPRTFMLGSMSALPHRSDSAVRRDVEQSLRLPVTQGRAAELASASSVPPSSTSASSNPPPIFEYSFLSLGRGRARPSSPPSSSPPLLKPNVATSSSPVRPGVGLSFAFGRGRGFLSVGHGD